MKPSATVSYQRHTLKDFVRDLGRRTPAPGGGSAAALVGGISAGLALMAVQYSVRPGKRNLQGFSRGFSRSANRFLKWVDDDAMAYHRLSQIRKKRKSQPRLYRRAARQALRVPCDVLAEAVCNLNRLRQFTPFCSPALLSDCLIAVCGFSMTVRGAALNVKVNLKEPALKHLTSSFEKSLSQLLKQAKENEKIIVRLAQEKR